MLSTFSVEPPHEVRRNSKVNINSIYCFLHDFIIIYPFIKYNKNNGFINFLHYYSTTLYRRIWYTRSIHIYHSMPKDVLMNIQKYNDRGYNICHNHKMVPVHSGHGPTLEQPQENDMNNNHIHILLLHRQYIKVQDCRKYQANTYHNLDTR